MKKVFSFVLAVAVIATALGISVGTASAAGSSVVLYLPGVTQQDLNNASMFVGSEYHKVECTLRDAETGKVVCHVPGKYAGQDVKVYLAGQVFDATVPAPNTPEAETKEPFICGEGEIMGAMITATFIYYGGPYTYSWYGTSLDEIVSSFESWHSYWGGGSYEIGDLFCTTGEA